MGRGSARAAEGSAGREPAGAMGLALLAIGLWSTLALTAATLGRLPPLLVCGVALCVGAMVSLPRARQWVVSPVTLAVGFGGICGYHLLYFGALALAPRVEANLLNYLWPLLIVAGTPVVFPGRRLAARHWVGVTMGFAGMVLITGPAAAHFRIDGRTAGGYACAIGAAVVWATYSLLTKRLPAFPTAAVGGFCMLSGVTALGIHAALGPRVVPTRLAWAGMVYAGLGPLGVAFYAWDAALKRGDPRTIGACSYITPLLSTLLLVVVRGEAMRTRTIVAMVLILGGAVAGAKRGGGREADV